MQWTVPKIKQTKWKYLVFGPSFKSVSLFQTNELLLTDDGYQVIRNTGGKFPNQIRTMGIYLVIEVNEGLILMWDKKTSLFIKLSPSFQVNKNI